MKVVVFSGGAGTRMWPLSRQSRPKQFQNLVGNKSMFQQMMEMVLSGFSAKDVLVLTGSKYISLVKKQIPILPEENIVGEPEMRDTLAAVSFACAYVEKNFPGETMAAIWGADHIVAEKKTFVKALKTAEKLAREENVIAKVDVHPSFPSVHLGYIEIGNKVKKIDGFEVFEFIRQVEKPNHSDAEKFLESGNYLWNTGYFVWPLPKIMSLIKKYNRQTYDILIKIQKAIGTNQQKTVIEKEYKKIPKMSIDHALFEKLGKKDQLEIAAVLGWKDIGTWNVLKDELADREDLNVVIGEHVDIGSVDCLVHQTNSSKLVATIGLESLIVVDTPDALLICPKARSHDVKRIVQELKEKKKTGYL